MKTNLINTSSDALFNNMGIFQVYVSPSIFPFKNRIKKIYHLKDYTNKNLPVLIFGIYRLSDLGKIKDHKGLIYIMWAGTDADFSIPKMKNNLQILKNNNNIVHIATSENISERLAAQNLQFIRIKLNLIIFDYFKPKNTIGNKIYIYNGYSVTNDKEIYGKKIYDKIIQKMPEYQFLFSDQLNLPYDKIQTIYSQCFIGIRLTEKDGPAYTVPEMGLMGLPVIHNGEYPNGIRWVNEDDIIQKIKYYSLTINKYISDQRFKIFNYFYNFPNLNISEQINKNFVPDFQNVSQIKISKQLKKFDQIIKKKYNLEEYNDKKKSSIFFGIYDEEDNKFLLNHESISVIIWHGQDILYKYNYQPEFFDIIKKKKIINIAVSDHISQLLNCLGIKHVFNTFSLIEQDKFTSMEFGKDIYCYIGQDSHHFNLNLIENIKNKLKNFNFIFSNEKNDFEQLLKIYQKCFICLRLCEFDGSADIIQEFGMMGKNCIHKGNYPNSIHWKDENDLINIIIKENENIGKMNNVIKKKMINFIDKNSNKNFLSIKYLNNFLIHNNN